MSELEELNQQLRTLREINDQLERKQKLEMNLTATSRLQTTGTGQQSMHLAGDRSFEEFRDGYIGRMQKRGLDIKGRTYAEIVEELCYHRP